MPDAPMEFDDREALMIEIADWADGDNFPVGMWKPIAKDAGVLDALLALDAEERAGRDPVGGEALAREMIEQVKNASPAQITEYMAHRDAYLDQ